MCLKGGARKMDEPLVSKRKLTRLGHSKYVLIPAYSKIADEKEVLVAVYDDQVIIRPVKR